MTESAAAASDDSVDPADLIEGDAITVYAAGHSLGDGTFIRLLDDDGAKSLSWINSKGNLNYTTLDALTVKKRPSTDM